MYKVKRLDDIQRGVKDKYSFVLKEGNMETELGIVKLLNMPLIAIIAMVDDGKLYYEYE